MGNVRVVVVFLMLVVASCSGSQNVAGPEIDSTEPRASTDTTEPEPKPTTTMFVLPEFSDSPRADVEVPTSFADETSEIFDRYLIYREAKIAAAGVPFADSEDVTLAGLHTGTQQTKDQERLEELQGDNQVLRRPTPSVSDSSIGGYFTGIPPKSEGETMSFRDCQIEDAEVISLSDGEVLESGTNTTLYNVIMEVVDGQWRVASTLSMAEYDGESDCPVSTYVTEEGELVIECGDEATSCGF